MTLYVPPDGGKPSVHIGPTPRSETHRLRQAARGKRGGRRGDRASNASVPTPQARPVAPPAPAPDRDAGGDTAPRRVQLRRTRNWRMPEGTIKVDRTSRWGNPYVVINGDAATAVAHFRRFLRGDRLYVRDRATVRYPDDAEIRRRLAGKSLGCWCRPDEPCHADVLLSIAAGGAP